MTHEPKAALPKSAQTGHPSRLAADHPSRQEIHSRHSAALRGGEHTYEDPDTGLLVFTAGYLSLTAAHVATRDVVTVRTSNDTYEESWSES